MLDALRDIKDRLADLERGATRVFRYGVVDTVDRTKCRVTVTFPLSSTVDPTTGKVVPRNVKSGGMPVLVKQSVKNRDYWMPDVGERVLCLFLPNDSDTGFVLGSFYSDEDPIPDGAEDEGMRVVQLADGARFEYSTDDSEGHAQVGDVDIEIAADHVSVLAGNLETEFTADYIRMGGDDATQPFVRGTDHKTLLSALIDLVAAHTHPTGMGPSGPPANAADLTAKKADIDGTLSTIIQGK
jgi:phage baseplate assembly protein V